jgi:hypothetical protein
LSEKIFRASAATGRDHRGFDLISDALPFSWLCWNVGFPYGLDYSFTTFAILAMPANYSNILTISIMQDLV